MTSSIISAELEVSRTGLHRSPMAVGLRASKWHLETCAISSHRFCLCERIGNLLRRSLTLLLCSSAVASVLGEYFSHVG